MELSFFRATRLAMLRGVCAAGLVVMPATFLFYSTQATLRLDTATCSLPNNGVIPGGGK